MKTLKAIYFDIDNTLFATSSFVKEARLKGVEAMIQAGLKIEEPQDIMHLLEEVVREFGSNDGSHFNKLLKRLPLSSFGGHNLSTLEAAGVVGYGQTKFRRYKPHEDVTEVLKELSQTSLILGILSNGRSIKQAEKIFRLGILPYLNPQAIFISDDVGMAKPNPKIFKLVCQKFDLTPDEVMIVGDHPELDIGPSKKLGMISVQNCRNIEPSRKHPEADYHINNFWDLLEIVKKDFQMP